MTVTESRAVVRHLGGEGAHRSFFGGTHSKARIAGFAIFITLGLVLTPPFGFPGLLVGLIGTAVTYLLTFRTHRGSIGERREKRARWKGRVAAGTDAYTPFDAERWVQLQQSREQAALVRGREGKEALWRIDRAITAMRTNPDGADGMGWLQFGNNRPGIAWHAPVGEAAYVSVTFAVTGQLRGIESQNVLTLAAESWGAFLASRATPASLVGDVQVTTRVLPSDTALQEFWVSQSLDPDVPEAAQRSYEEVLIRTGRNAMVQRHYVTLKWPITAAFTSAADKYGSDRDGWRALMALEIEASIRGLREARMGQVEVLTARQLTAVMLHMQNPSRPIDWVKPARPNHAGEASHDEFSAHVVSGVDPVTGLTVEWWHRTAAIKAENLSTAGRNQLWMLGLLTGDELKVTRTVSLHIHLIPAAEAKAAAQKDLLRDQAELLSRRESGKMDTDDTNVRARSAQRRQQDLISGSRHHGASWIGYVSITGRSREELVKASRQLEDTCSNSLGVERLEWMDSYQSAASGTTWPIGRGLRAEKTTFVSNVLRSLAGTSEKEAIS